MAADLQQQAQRDPPASDGILEDEAGEKEAPKRKRRRRHPLPEHLERQKVVLEPADLQPCAQCSRPAVRIGEETSEELEYVPARLVVRLTVHPKYACRCGCCGVTIADLPPRLLPQGKLGYPTDALQRLPAMNITQIGDLLPARWKPNPASVG